MLLPSAGASSEAVPTNSGMQCTQKYRRDDHVPPPPAVVRTRNQYSVQADSAVGIVTDVLPTVAA